MVPRRLTAGCGRAVYRVRQFARAVGARPHPAALAVLDTLLSEGERALFFAQSSRDQHHGLETLRLLKLQGEPSRELSRAALLHDAGKGYIRLHERVIYVLLAAVAPRLLERFCAANGSRLPGALARIRTHPTAGAARLAVLGASQRELDLIRRHHQQPGDDRELAALIAADDQA